MILYRYEYFQYGETSTEVKIALRKFHAYKETKCGYWIRDFGKNRWVRKTSRKRFAYPTEQEAWTSLRLRTKRRRAILKAQLRQCDAILNIMNKDDNTKIKVNVY
jgi:hypothetical protein